ncbi:MAG: glycosyltransferase family 2 protein [Gammaproteobacteria bacterium]
MSISIIIPAKNEQEGLQRLLPELVQRYSDAEIIVVNDGSDDDTVKVAEENNTDVMISHPYSMGNGAAVKTGARTASGDILVFMDADGQHSPKDIQKLLDKIEEGYDMVVGSRDNSGQANLGRLFANRLYNFLATRISGHSIMDLTSGFRAVRADVFRQFLYLLPNGFSYPTSITMAFFRAGYSVTYVPIDVKIRIGKSHLRPIRDGIRFLLIIFKIGTLYSPLKIFVPVSFLFFVTGLSYYAYTYITMSRFTNMSALLFISSILVFMIGLVSEQVTTLMYSNIDKRDDDS